MHWRTGMDGRTSERAYGTARTFFKPSKTSDKSESNLIRLKFVAQPTCKRRTTWKSNVDCTSCWPISCLHTLSNNKHSHCKSTEIENHKSWIKHEDAGNYKNDNWTLSSIRMRASRRRAWTLYSICMRAMRATKRISA